MDHLIFDGFAIKESKIFIADTICDYNVVSPKHDHDFYEFIVVLSGSFIEHLNEKDYVIEKSTAHFLRPSDVHYYTGLHKKNTNLLRNIAIRKDFFEELIQELNFLDLKNIYTPSKISINLVETFIEKTNQLFDLSYSEETRIFMVKSIVYDIIFGLQINNIHTKEIPSWLIKTNQQFLKDKNYLQGIDKLICISGKSQEHVTRAFKKYFSYTPTEFINKLKLQYAANLLINTEKKILDIILESGFDNISYFNRLFKKHLGMTPSEYRDFNNKKHI